MKSPLLRLLLLVFACCPAILSAQDTASITGTVTDPTGAAVAGAQVTVTSVEQGTSRNATANSSGEYLFAAMPVGSYNMTVTAQGFKKYQARAIKLDVGQKARNDVQMQVGAAQETVNVEGINVAQVETQSSDLAGTVTGKQITQLELNGRNFTQLVTLVPGVSNQTGQDEGTVGVYGNVAFSVNGGRTEYNNWELDGGDNMDNGSNETLNVYPSLEAISEFKVLTSNYGAQYGRNGSGTVEVETKSGTNSFHGNVYEFVRNDAFNARNYFQQSVPPYKKNDYGYTIGGPIWKNKTFFFWSEEWRRDRVPGQNFNESVPSIAERAGDFSDQCAPINPNGNCPSVGADLTAAGFNPNDPTIQGLLSEIPLPTQGGGANSAFVSSPVQPTNWREELIRVDHNLTDKERITFRFIHDSWDTITPVPLWTNQGSFPTIQTAFKGPGVALVARLNSTFSPTLLNEFVFSYTTDHIVLNNVGNWKRSTFPGFVVPDIFPGNGDNILPGINLVTGAYGGGFGEDAGYIPNGVYNSNPTYTFRDNVNKIVGKHNFQFGAYAVAGQKNELGGELGPGSIPGYLTFDDSNATVTTGNAFADLLLGRISSFGQQDVRLKYYNRYKILEPYFQDDWHATNRLTLNLGLRVSLLGTYREKKKQAYNFDPARYDPTTAPALDASGALVPSATANPFDGIVQCGGPGGAFPIAGFPSAAVGGSPYPGCVKGHLFNPGPRIGFAYDLTGNGKTAIRGGYGIFFEHANGNEGNSESLENSSPLANAAQRNNIIGYSGTGLAQGPSPLSVTSIPNKAVWPYIQQWHLDVQHEVARNTVATVSYVGSKGTHLNRQTDLNQLHPTPLSQNPYGPGEFIDTDSSSPTFNTDCTDPANPLVNGSLVTGQPAVNVGVAACGLNPDPFRPYAGYGDIAHLEFKASSIYHAFQTSVRRSVGGLQLSFAYTWSHSIDDASDRFDGSFVNSYDPQSNRASSNFDQRHILNFSYVWDLPFFKNPGVANKVLGGWQFSGITSFQTGTPFSVIVSSDNAGVANGIGSAARADRVGDPRTGVTQVPFCSSNPTLAVCELGPQIYNPNAYALPRGLTFGDSGRNTLNNTHWTNFDMALFKHFRITESMAFEFRAEAFNIFNHTQWRPIAGDSGSAASNLGESNNTFDTDPSNGFLQVTDAHNPRILQLGAKFIF